MNSFFLKLFWPTAYFLLFLAGCSAGPSGGMVPSPFAASGPAGAAGPSTVAGGNDEGSDGGDGMGRGETTDLPPPAGGEHSIVSDTPINVIGAPIASTPTDRCVDSSTPSSFVDLEMAVTGRHDTEGRQEVLFQQRLVSQEGSGPPVGFQGSVVLIHGPASIPATSPWLFKTGFDGCLVGKIYGQPGQTVRFQAFVRCCEETEAVAGGTGTRVMALKSFGSCNPYPGEMTLTLPAETEAKTLPSCTGMDFPPEPPSHGGVEVRGAINQNPVLQQ